jgi:zinc transport system substrate-binding protein
MLVPVFLNMRPRPFLGMMKRGAILILLVMLAACAPAEKGEKLKVVASFYPLAYFTEQVGGDLVDVSMLVPAGVGVHDWEPTSQDIRILQNGDVFVYNGIAEFWAESILKSVPSSLVIVKVSEGLSLLEGEEHEEEHEEEEHE